MTEPNSSSSDSSKEKSELDLNKNYFDIDITNDIKSDRNYENKNETNNQIIKENLSQNNNQHIIQNKDEHNTIKLSDEVLSSKKIGNVSTYDTPENQNEKIGNNTSNVNKASKTNYDKLEGINFDKSDNNLYSAEDAKNDFSPPRTNDILSINKSGYKPSTVYKTYDHNSYGIRSDNHLTKINSNTILGDFDLTVESIDEPENEDSQTYTHSDKKLPSRHRKKSYSSKIKSTVVIDIAFLDAKENIKKVIEKKHISKKHLDFLTSKSLIAIKNELKRDATLKDFIFSKDDGVEKLIKDAMKKDKNSTFNAYNEDRELQSFSNIFDSADEEEMSDMDEDEDGSQFIYDFDSFFKKKYWNFIVFLTIILSILIQPFYLANAYSFDPKLDKKDILFVFIFIEIILQIDIFLNFLAPFQNTVKNITVTNSKYTILNYLSGYFLFDFIISLPLDIIYYCTYSAYDNFYYFIKWVSILRIVKLFSKEYNMNFIEKMLKKFLTDIEVIRASIFVLMFFIFVHVMTCLWITVGYISTDNQSWIYVYADGKTSGDIYLTSFYFNLVSVFTVGYGDITAKNIWERFFNIIMMIFGIGTYSFLITSLSGVFGKMDMTFARKQELQDMLDTFSEDYILTEEIYINIREIITVIIHQNIVGFNDVLESLPFSVRTDLLLKMHNRNINNLKIFQNKSRDFILYLLPLLQPSKFIKGTSICSIEEIIEEMFIVTNGLLSVTLGPMFNNIEIYEIKKNMLFGDVLSYANLQCPYDIVSKKDTEVLILNKLNFLDLKLKFNEQCLNILEENLKVLYQMELRRKVFVELSQYTKQNHLITKCAEYIDFKALEKNFMLFYNNMAVDNDLEKLYTSYLTMESLEFVFKKIICGDTSEVEIRRNDHKSHNIRTINVLNKLDERIKKLKTTASGTQISSDGGSKNSSSVKYNSQDTIGSLTKDFLLKKKETILNDINLKQLGSPMRNNWLNITSEDKKEKEYYNIAKKILNFALLGNGFETGSKINNKSMTYNGLGLISNQLLWNKLVNLNFSPLTTEINDFKEVQKLKEIDQLNDTKLNFIKKIIKYEDDIKTFKNNIPLVNDAVNLKNIRDRKRQDDSDKSKTNDLNDNLESDLQVTTIIVEKKKTRPINSRDLNHSQTTNELNDLTNFKDNRYDNNNHTTNIFEKDNSNDVLLEKALEEFSRKKSKEKFDEEVKEEMKILINEETHEEIKQYVSDNKTIKEDRILNKKVNKVDDINTNTARTNEIKSQNEGNLNEIQKSIIIDDFLNEEIKLEKSDNIFSVNQAREQNIDNKEKRNELDIEAKIKENLKTKSIHTLNDIKLLNEILNTFEYFEQQFINMK